MKGSWLPGNQLDECTGGDVTGEGGRAQGSTGDSRQMTAKAQNGSVPRFVCLEPEVTPATYSFHQSGSSLSSL